MFVSTVAADFRVSLNATAYQAAVQSNIDIGTPVLMFTIYINNTYFQTPQSVLIQPSSDNLDDIFALDNGDDDDVVVFEQTNNFDKIIAISRSIIYNRIATTAGEYKGSLTITVLVREDSGVDQESVTSCISFNVTIVGT